MAKQFTSSRGRIFTHEELENLPPFDINNNDHDAWLEYENEHGISPDEVHAYMSKIENERLNELEADVMMDAYGRPYEQLRMDFSELDKVEDVETELDEDLETELDEVEDSETELDEVEDVETKKKPRVSERLANIKNRIQYGAWHAMNRIPEKTKETVDNLTGRAAVTVVTKQDEILENLKEKHYLVKKNIEAKGYIRDFASGNLTKEQLAHLMASDADLQKSISSVSHSMLHPSPIKGLKTERTNLQFDVGYGFSVFMEELRQPLDSEVEAVMEIDNMSMLIEMGQDKNIPPTVRENYLHEAGIPQESMEEFVTRDDYRDYVTRLEHKFRHEHMSRLGLLDKDMLDIEDENMLNDLVADSMSLHNEDEAFMYTPVPEGDMDNTYQAIYNMTSEEMFRMFDHIDNYENLNYEDLNFPTYVDYDFDGAEFMRRSVSEYHALQDMSIADTEEYLKSIEAEMRAYETQMQAPPEPDDELVPPELSDEDLASLDNQSPPPELSEEDLASLYSQSPPPELSDDDLKDLYENNQTQQK